MPKFLNSELHHKLLQRIDACRQQVHSFQSYSQKQMMQAPSPEKWSANECFQHLVLVQNQYIENINKSLAKNHRAKSSYNTGWFGSWFYKNMLPESKVPRFRRQRTLKQMVPGNDPGAEQRFLESLSEFEKLVQGIPQQNLSKRVVSLAGPLLTFKLGDAYRIVIAHNERHIEQAGRAIL